MTTQVDGQQFIRSGTTLIRRWSSTGPTQDSFDTATNTFRQTILGVDGIVATPTLLEIKAVPVTIERELTLIDADITYTANMNLIEIPAATTITMNVAGSTVRAFLFNPTIEQLQSMDAFGGVVLIQSSPIVKNESSVAPVMGPCFGFSAQIFFQADAQVITIPSVHDYSSSPQAAIVSGGTLTLTEHNALRCFEGSIGAGATITTRRGVFFSDASVAGTLTNQIAIDIEALSAAGTLNLGIRCDAEARYGDQVIVGTIASAPNVGMDITTDVAWRETARALSNGSNAAVSTANTSYLRITGPSAGFTIEGFANGFDGKRLVIYNTTAQNMTIAHQSGSDAAANRIITNTGANVTSTGVAMAEFIYSSADSRWILTSFEG